ncbi:unnamed protein product [Brachionus calyciflorus]|uniref:DDE-1 domain-containing protein n=1 Tax=Brachionus calyciflorus TaxID=104777 RepID=A0A814NNM4_9BILA|nr:unnamed protein product [Brachionus calyciflorus]
MCRWRLKVSYDKTVITQRKAIRYSFNTRIDTKINELYNLCSLEPVLERSLKLTDKYLCEAAKSNELIQRELNIYRQAPELDEGGLCKGIASKTVFGFIQSMECRKFFQKSNAVEWIESFNNYIRLKDPNRKICLLIDNASSHKDTELSNKVIKFLPPNMTSVLQPQSLIHVNVNEGEVLSLSELLERFITKYYEFKQTEKNEEFISVKDYLSIEETESTDEDLSDEDILDLVLNNDCDDENLNSNVSETKDQHRPFS